MSPTRRDHEELTVVLVDDDAVQLELLRRCVDRVADRIGPCRVREYADACEALAELPPDGPTVVLCDYMLVGSCASDWLPDFLRADTGPVIVVTSSGCERIAAESLRDGAADYVEKSVIFEEPSRLAHAIRDALRRWRMEQANRSLARRLKHANAELERKNHALAELTETAHRFVDDVAHEFRTPLAVISEFTSIIDDGIGGPVTDRQQEFLQHIRTAARDLAHLVDDFLDTGRLRARTLRVERRDRTASEIVEGCRAVLASRAEAAGVDLRIELPASLPPVRVDPDKARRSLVNLVINAIKFGGRGTRVTVEAGIRTDGFVTLSVTDEGPGMPPEEVERLFARFRQGAGARDADRKGFGLGLAIVRDLVAVNLGEVQVRSAPGEGSTFSFTMPVADDAVVLDAFLARLAERAPQGFVSCVRARREGPAGPFEDLAELVASMSHATDLVFAAPDGSVVLVGDTGEVGGWCDRLARSFEESTESMPADAIGRVVFEPVGAWPRQEARRHVAGVLEAVGRTGEGRRRSA